MNTKNLTSDVVARKDGQQLAVITEIPSAPGQLTVLQRFAIDALLVFVTLIWGSSFLIEQYSIRLVGPFTTLAIRFSIAALVLVLVFYQHFRRITRAEIVAGSTIGIFLFAGYALQALGLQDTTTSMTGFLTALYVPLVPVFSIFVLRQRLNIGIIIAVFLSFLGLVLLSLGNKFTLSFGPGELLVIGCAVAYALQIVAISKFAPRMDAVNLSIVQIALTALLCTLVIPIVHEPFAMPSLSVWGANLFLGVGATAFALLVMNRVQQFMSGVRATLIYALEPAWTGLFGYLVGERLGMLAWVGCLCILLAMVIGSIRFDLIAKRRKRA